jgi:hypothetical protein
VSSAKRAGGSPILVATESSGGCVRESDEPPRTAHGHTRIVGGLLGWMVFRVRLELGCLRLYLSLLGLGSLVVAAVTSFQIGGPHDVRGLTARVALHGVTG